jgi:hypothetical protein
MSAALPGSGDKVSSILVCSGGQHLGFPQGLTLLRFHLLDDPPRQIPRPSWTV